MKISQTTAKSTLIRAYSIAEQDTPVHCQHEDFINYVIDNTHLTYKYVLFTALLSKATDETINALCLQKKSALFGAYDARSICHKVIVPFEMEVLHKVLGGSNEPFLNKPARFTELDKSNAVRKGNDQLILNSLCDNLPNIASADIAFSCLVYMLRRLIVKRDEMDCLIQFVVADCNSQKAVFYKFAADLLSKNLEGEALTLVVAGLYEQLLINESDHVVEVHPVNQSGASRKEISDLDVYCSGVLYTSNELKDKDFEYTDIKHAADKVIAAGGNHLFFIIGLHGRARDAGEVANLVTEYLDKGFVISLLSVTDFINMMLGLIMQINAEDFIRYIIEIARNTKFKQETIEYVLTTAKLHYDLTLTT